MVDLVNPRSLLLREPNLLIPGRKPIGLVRVDWGHHLTDGLCACWVAGVPVDLTDGVLYEQDGATLDAGVAVFDGTSAGSIYSSGEKIVTSDGAGTGDFTIAAYANPVSRSALDLLIGQKWDPSGSPWAQTGIYANCNDAFGVSPGAFAFMTYNGSTSGVYAPSVIDGAWHMFWGVREAGGMAVDVDGSPKASATRTVMDVSDGLRKVVIGNGGKGTDEDCYLGEQEVAFAWNRAINDADRKILSADPYQFLIKP